MAKLTASVVGCGGGGRLSMKALAASSRFALVAAADLKPEARRSVEEAFPGIRTFAGHQEMFAACPTDVVCVSTFPPSHEPVTLDALKLPLKGILVEKPLGHTAASGRRLLDAIKARGIPMAVPHGMLARVVPLEIILRVRKGEIGALKLVEIQCDKWDIINAGIHWLDFFVTLIGGEPMDHVMAICDSSTRTWRDGMQVETTAVTYAQTRSGIRVVMNTGDYIAVNGDGNPANFLFRLVGTQGLIEFGAWASTYRILNGQNPQGTVVTPPAPPVGGHQFHLENMAAMIDSGRPDYTIPDNSLSALEICEGAYLSSRHRCKVTFPLASFTPPTATDWDPGMPYGGQGGGRDGRKLTP